MFIYRRRALSQVFLKNRPLIKKLIRRSSIGKNDTVLEIGPGTGNITEELLHVARKVIVVEIDPTLTKLLRSKYFDNQNLTLHQMDFMHFQLPNYPYKVFANPPFSIQGKLVRKLLDATNPPEDCYLVLRKDFAYRLGGIRKDGELSRYYKKRFEFEIVHQFKGSDFKPKTRVWTVMLKIERK